MKISLEFDENELYQLLLCVVCRSGFIAQRQATSCSADEEKILNMQQNMMANLNKKIEFAFEESKKEDDEEKESDAN